MRSGKLKSGNFNREKTKQTVYLQMRTLNALSGGATIIGGLSKVAKNPSLHHQPLRVEKLNAKSRKKISQKKICLHFLRRLRAALLNRVWSSKDRQKRDSFNIYKKIEVKKLLNFSSHQQATDKSELRTTAAPLREANNRQRQTRARLNHKQTVLSLICLLAFVPFLGLCLIFFAIFLCHRVPAF